jgi:hypothetical protein
MPVWRSSTALSWPAGERGVVFLDHLRAVSFLRDQFLLRQQVVREHRVQFPDGVEFLQFRGVVVPVVAHELADRAQFFCSTWAPSFLFPGLDRVKVI